MDKVDRLVNLVGEMVITQAMISEQLRDVPPGTLQQLVEGLEEWSRHTRELQESVMAIRAQQVRSVFSRMPRLVREVAAQTGKEVQLATSGETTEVDKTVVENLVDPLTHMIRNSIDQGLKPTSLLTQSIGEGCYKQLCAEEGFEFRRCSWRSAVGFLGIRNAKPEASNELGGQRVRGCLVWG